MDDNTKIYLVAGTFTAGAVLFYGAVEVVSNLYQKYKIRKRTEELEEKRTIKEALEGKLTFSEFEQRLGITETRDDCPSDRYCGDDCPTSDYYLDEEPDFEGSHRTADKALAKLEKYLAQSPQS